MTGVDRFGFPRQSAKLSKVIAGFKTGNIVSAKVTKRLKMGRYIGRVTIRESGSFNITTKYGTIQGINYRYCNIIQKGDGHAYHSKKRA